MDESLILLSIRQTQIYTGELLIFSLGDYHKVAVSCFSYPLALGHIATYDYRVSCKDRVLDLQILNDSLFRVVAKWASIKVSIYITYIAS